MRNFFNKLTTFLSGRYGNDQLNIFLLILWFVLAIVSVFFRNPIVAYIILALETLLLVLYLFRAFSKNIYKRGNENRKFLSVMDAIKGFFTLQKRKTKDVKTHRYIRCTHCKAHLRVRNEKGKHTVRCPKCKQEFETNIVL